MPVDTPPTGPDDRSGTSPVELGSHDPLRALHRWVAEGTVDEAARARARRRWIEQQADEEATLAGVLHDLAEREGTAVLTTRRGRRVGGRIVVVGADFAIVREAGGDVVVPASVLSSVRPGPDDHPVAGARAVGVELVLAEALAELAADRPDVFVVTAAEEVKGRLRSVGFDVIAVAIEGAGRRTVHVPVGALDHVLLP